MQRVVKKISGWLIENGSIQAEDRELYEYAIVSTFFNIAPLILAIIVGLALDMCLEAIAMIIPFILLRKYLGGYHAKSPYVCFGCSIMVVIMICEYIKFVDNMFINVVLFAASVIFIAVTKPAGSENKPLDAAEKKTYKIIAVKILAGLSCIILVCFILGQSVIVRAMMSGIVLTTLLSLPCHILKH